MKYMDGAAAAQQRSFTVVSSALEPLREQRLPRVIRLGNWLGITMTNTETPRGWSFNPATVTLTLVILGMVAGGAYYMGQRDNEARNLLQRIEQAERDAADAKKLQTYSAGVADTHAKEKEEKKK